MKALRILLIACLPMLCSSCLVTKKKYNRAEEGRMAALYSRDSLAVLLQGSRVSNENLRRQNAALERDTAQMGKGLRTYQSMLANSNSENQKLLGQLNERLAQLDDREKTIEQLQGVINEQNARVRQILDQVKSALNGFSSSDLTVREEGGKVYVAMSDKLLFESGSAVVNDKGREALGKLSLVLNEQTDVDVYIEGHTDSVPIHTVQFRDNWDLSVIRATSVVRILTEGYGVSPLQIQPCGRGEFKPVDTNKSAEGRARNRRTEIIIAPRLDKLYDLLRLGE